MKAVTKGQKASSWEDTFILVFYRLLQAVRIHKDNNDLVKGCLVQFKQTLAQFDLEDDLTIVVSEERFFIQGERLQIRKDQVRLFKALLDFFLIRALHGLRRRPFGDGPFRPRNGLRTGRPVDRVLGPRRAIHGRTVPGRTPVRRPVPVVPPVPGVVVAVTIVDRLPVKNSFETYLSILK